VKAADLGTERPATDTLERPRAPASQVEPTPGLTYEAAAVNTATFTETGGRTTLTVLVQHACKEHRDAHIASGMEDGLQDALDLLEQVSISLA
jgi:hypothetical protein